MKDNKYQCSICKGVFETEWDGAEAELDAVWGGKFKKEDCGVVCDDCYRAFMKNAPPDAKVENCHFAQHSNGGVKPTC